MTLLFFAALILLIGGLSAMNPVSIALGVAGVVYSVHKIDARQQRETRARMDAQHQEAMARDNGHPRGNVDLVVRSRGDE